MQVYRGMDLGTGKPERSIQREIPHHGLDLVGPEEEFNVARYLEMVQPTILAIQARGRLPLLVAGSGLYLRGLLDGLCPAPGEDPVLRGQLLKESQQIGVQALHARLVKVDPAAAARIHPNDCRRIVRALEVFSVTGRPLSEWQRQLTPRSGLGQEIRLVGLICDRAALYRRIEQRIDGWLKLGWLEEAKKLAALPLSRTAREALGYRELFDFLAGKMEWESAQQLIKQNTRRYAKRQWTWFKADPRVVWIQTDGKEPETLAAEIQRLQGM